MREKSRQVSEEIPKRRLDERVGAVEDEVIRMQTSLNGLKWIGGIIVTVFLGSIFVISAKIFSWGYDSGEVTTRVRHLENTVEAMKIRLDVLAGRKESQ